MVLHEMDCMQSIMELFTMDTIPTLYQQINHGFCYILISMSNDVHVLDINIKIYLKEKKCID